MMSTTPLQVSTSPTEPGTQLPGREGILMIRGIVMEWEKLRLMCHCELLVLGVVFSRVRCR